MERGGISVLGDDGAQGAGTQEAQVLWGFDAGGRLRCRGRGELSISGNGGARQAGEALLRAKYEIIHNWTVIFRLFLTFFGNFTVLFSFFCVFARKI